MATKREAVIIGAGKMGRGFCAEILASAGCHLTFVDSDEARVERLRSAGGYTIYKARRTYFETVSIEGFDALPLKSEGEISDRIAHRGVLVMIAVPSAQIEAVASLLCVCIARKALERKTGARGLRSIMEQLLLDVMYNLPTEKDVVKVIIDENAVTHETKPLLIYRDKEETVDRI